MAGEEWEMGVQGDKVKVKESVLTVCCGDLGTFVMPLLSLVAIWDTSGEF